MKTGIELRSVNCEIRSAGNLKLEGYGAVFGAEYDCGAFKETIAPGAFTPVLDSDVCCLFNHNPNDLLGRTTSGTLRIGQDSKGLSYSVDLPDIQMGRDIHAMVERGDVSGSSFSFIIGEQEWSDGGARREIVSIQRLYDVGPVTYPAYRETSVAARHLQRRYRTMGVCKVAAAGSSSRGDLESERERLQLLIQIARLK